MFKAMFFVCSLAAQEPNCLKLEDQGDLTYSTLEQCEARLRQMEVAAKAYLSEKFSGGTFRLAGLCQPTGDKEALKLGGRELSTLQ